MMVNELVGNAAVGFGGREPAHWQAERMQVYVTHSLKVEVIRIHEGKGLSDAGGMQACVLALVSEIGQYTTMVFNFRCFFFFFLHRFRSFSNFNPKPDDVVW